MILLFVILHLNSQTLVIENSKTAFITIFQLPVRLQTGVLIIRNHHVSCELLILYLPTSHLLQFNWSSYLIFSFS